jgi:hypothetical protein
VSVGLAGSGGRRTRGQRDALGARGSRAHSTAQLQRLHGWRGGGQRLPAKPRSIRAHPSSIPPAADPPPTLSPVSYPVAGLLPCRRSPPPRPPRPPALLPPPEQAPGSKTTTTLSAPLSPPSLPSLAPPPALQTHHDVEARLRLDEVELLRRNLHAGRGRKEGKVSETRRRASTCKIFEISNNHPTRQQHAQVCASCLTPTPIFTPSPGLTPKPISYS